MNELAQALIGTSAFAAPAAILEDVSATLAAQTPANAPHSLYAEVWHLAFWQDISLDWVQGKPTPVPERAADGFPPNNLPPDNQEPWDQLRTRFLAGAQAAAALSNLTDRLNDAVLCPTIGNPHRIMSVRDQLISLAAHNAYHLGRIVLLRQLLGEWPPAAGGYTW